VSLLTGGQSGQLLNSGVLSGVRQDPPAKRFLDIHADLVPLGILDGRRTAHRPAPSPSMQVHSPRKRLENGLWDSSTLFSPEELETAQVHADGPDWEGKEMKQCCFR